MNDALRLWIRPVVIESGQRLIREGNDTTTLRSRETTTFDSDVVVLAYEPADLDHDMPSLLEDWQPTDGRSISELAMAMLGIAPDRGANPTHKDAPDQE